VGAGVVGGDEGGGCEGCGEDDEEALEEEVEGEGGAVEGAEEVADAGGEEGAEEEGGEGDGGGGVGVGFSGGEAGGGEAGGGEAEDYGVACEGNRLLVLLMWRRVFMLRVYDIPVCIPTNTPQLLKAAASHRPVTKQQQSSARSPCLGLTGPNRFLLEKKPVIVVSWPCLPPTNKGASEELRT